MQSHSVEKVSEVGDAYWRHRVVTLEILVAELLVKNQNMRFNLKAVEQQRSTAEGAGIEMVHNQRVSSPQS
jgi:hypothetical protein